MELVLDLHLHSRFSRAVSPRMNLQNMYLWGRKKGINILSVSDFTHPIWFKEAENLLEEVQSGIYKLKDTDALDNELGTLSEKNILVRISCFQLRYPLFTQNMEKVIGFIILFLHLILKLQGRSTRS